ncbi:uncharacterized protein RMCC_4173 [Mycolicibacterium canariasense]|uniref:Uncharacterized protein n=1 Tax=Mycolicibacterium canariasense TaxID=228230 RepID=A0A100WEN6_MYCCR|nr:uncharacterized protein RMCC_4173 [Mycolicibacterium canariasense]
MLQPGGTRPQGVFTGRRKPITLPFWRLNQRECTLFKAHGPQAVHAPLAQSAERFHGKEKVNGSIPLGGSVDARRIAAFV